MHWEPRVENEPCRREKQSYGQHATNADSRCQRLRDRRERDDRDGQANVCDPRLDRGVMEHLLHVERQQEELGEHRRREQQRGSVRRRKRAQLEDPHR